MNHKYRELSNAMKHNEITPPKEIRSNGKYQEFVANIDSLGQPVKAWCISKDGVAIYGCKSLNILKKWSSKKVETMTDSELRHYKKIMRDLKVVRDKYMASDSISKENKKADTFDKPFIKESGRPLQITDPVPREKTLKVSKCNDQEILRDRVARRLLCDSIEVIGDRSKIKTLLLIKLLNSDEGMPWYVYNKGKPIGTQHLWRILEKFDIHSTDIRFKKGVAKGFLRESFLHAWRRILLLRMSRAKV